MGFADLIQELSHIVMDTRHLRAAPNALPLHRWQDEEDGLALAPFKALTREQAQALRQQDPPLSPWRVLLVQLGVGVVVALLAALTTGRSVEGWSALYGAATVVVQVPCWRAA